MNTPLVSIITINYNCPSVTDAMLHSLSLLNYPNWEVIVVDNASPQYSSAYLKKLYPFIKHISSPINVGFAGGNNIGLQFAKGDYVLFLNNDTEVTEDLVTELVMHLQKNPACAIACPKIKYHSMPSVIQYAGAMGLHPLTSRSYDIGRLQKDFGQYNDCRKTDLPNGASMMLPMRLINKIGVMSELFFLYYEELDWAAPFKLAGFEIHYVGTAEVFNKESVSTGIGSPLKTFYLFRNRLLYIRRNYRGIRRLIAVVFFLIISTPLHIIQHAVKKQWAHSKSIIQALRWNILHHPYTEPSIHSSSIVNQLVHES